MDYVGKFDVALRDGIDIVGEELLAGVKFSVFE